MSGIGRLARTLSYAHPLQIVARGPHVLATSMVGDVTGALHPRPVEARTPAPEELRALANAERARASSRMLGLKGDSRLRDYERNYGLELGGEQDGLVREWNSRAAFEPFPASVRARRIGVAMRCGRSGLVRELTRAARAVALQPELHLLGNHLLENGFALACAGAVTSGVEADVWWTLGRRILDWQLPQQILPDGGHVERSASYHLALTAALLETIELAESCRGHAPAAWREAASAMLGWLEVVTTPDGRYPLLNDASFDAAPESSMVQALGASLGVATSRSVQREQVGATSLQRLSATGWVRLDVGGACLVVDAGPDAGGWQPGHAHADGLSFELWADGQRVVVDYGVSSYATGAARVETRATRSHNTVEVEGRDSCEVWGAFRVGRRGTGQLIATTVQREHVEIELSHDGYAWLPKAPRHHRLLTLSSGLLEVRDWLSGGAHSAVSRLRVDASARVRVHGSGPVDKQVSTWYPLHGREHPAVSFSQPLHGGPAVSARWRLEW